MWDFTDEMFNLSETKNVDEEVEKLFTFYRKYGFPNYDKESYDLSKDFYKVKTFDEQKLFNSENKSISQSMVGLGVLWTYFPHWTEVCCGNATKSLQEMWNDDVELKKLLKKTYIWKLKHNEPHWTNNRIRQNAKVYLSKQSVSNFRPTAAKYIYNTYGNNGKVMDMSSGYGGRLMGFMSSNCNEYIGTDPCKKTFDGLVQLKKDLQTLENKTVQLYNHGSEEYMSEYKSYFDLCFTSPPYFDTEKYSNEESQSFKKYPTIDSWLNGFLNSTIENCFKYLKNDGYLIINIANIKNHNLEQPTIDLAIKNGFKHIDTLKLELSSIAGKGRKYEPIFIFQK